MNPNLLEEADTVLLCYLICAISYVAASSAQHPVQDCQWKQSVAKV
eukprot:CAMPEP_0178415652 /NCGR_PEP_ID=MMETSP0689_2-20121128/23660_1 /TAXON_ID=160604 /ORGANISM="Amphidinium massartii, Strain CS-259" /LENGTH=45 /DNA_ID= /DNA_START= /DNA_END= /DNA_ORIENTATION=